jgi:hypothetical protein
VASRQRQRPAGGVVAQVLGIGEITRTIASRFWELSMDESSLADWQRRACCAPFALDNLRRGLRR